MKSRYLFEVLFSLFGAGIHTYSYPSWDHDSVYQFFSLFFVYYACGLAVQFVSLSVFRCMVASVQKRLRNPSAALDGTITDLLGEDIPPLVKNLQLIVKLLENSRVQEILQNLDEQTIESIGSTLFSVRQFSRSAPPPSRSLENFYKDESE